jgi:L-threonylcarbamoyladenylate synthase
MVIKTELLKPNLNNIKKAVEVLKQGGLVIYPTETSYGIAADPFNETAVNKINQIKNRKDKAGFIVLCSNIRQAGEYGNVTKEERELTRSKQPTTIITKKKSNWPNFVNSDFVFRISPNPVARKLLKNFGKPITSTSANICGDPDTYSSREAYKIFSGKVDIVLDAGFLPKKKPSRIIKDGQVIRN